MPQLCVCVSVLQSSLHVLIAALLLFSFPPPLSLLSFLVVIVVVVVEAVSHCQSQKTTASSFLPSWGSLVSFLLDKGDIWQCHQLVYVALKKHINTLTVLTEAYWTHR